MNAILTDHATKRAKQRLGWKPETLKRMSTRAYFEGFGREETKGRVRKFIEREYDKHKTANNIRLYGEHVFVFCDKVLVTILHLPTDLVRLFHKQRAA